MALPIILASGAVNWKGDVNGTGFVGLVDVSGNLLGSVANPLQTADNGLPDLGNTRGTYGAASFRIPGVAATSQVLATIYNTGAYPVAIRRLAVDVNYSAAAAYLTQSYFRYWHITGVVPSGGANPTKQALDSAFPASQAGTVVAFAASADGTASAITHAIPAGTPTRVQALGNAVVATSLGFNPTNDYELANYSQYPLILRTNQCGMLALISSAASIATQHYCVKLVWEELAG